VGIMMMVLFSFTLVSFLLILFVGEYGGIATFTATFITCGLSPLPCRLKSPC
jgi:hypothetical protein